MPPKLALIFVFCFIIIILFVEHRKNREISSAIWIPTIWLLYSGSKQLGFWFQAHSTMEEGSVTDRFFLLMLGALGIVILQKRNFRWLSAFRKNYFVVLIIAYMLISTVWSRVPGLTFRRWGKEAICLIIACLIISERNPNEAIFSAFRKVIYISLPLSLLLIKYFPLYGIQYGTFTGALMWVGLAGQKNGLALMCCFSAVFLIWSLWKDIKYRKSSKLGSKSIIDLLLLLLSIYLMMGPRRTLTYSATSFLSLIVCLIMISYLKVSVTKRGRVNNNLILVVLILVVLVGIFMPMSGKIPIEQFPELLGRDGTLTNRTFIWNSLVPYAQRKILLGYGFGGFWTSSLRDEIATSAHNGYLDVILNLGLAGLFIFIFFFLSIANTSSKMIRTSWCMALLYLSIILMYLVHNITESSLTYLGLFPSSLIILFSFVINNENSEMELLRIKKQENQP